MAPMPTSRRRSRSVAQSEDEDEVQSSSIRQKRARRSEDNDHSTHGDVPLTDNVSRDQLHSLPFNGEYQPGSILRVKLENFVTYTAAEFFPGPKLNMVIGPNGTGKSTLVCAICIGLGWNPQYLGRAKEVAEFVKLGHQEATIEIELAKDGRRFKGNVIIRCQIRKDGNKTSYTVNGEHKSKKATVELARSLSIQIDNLCQFLPQDKVVEFAAMTPVELLRSTQRAVGDQDMIDAHDFLKEKRKSQKELQARIDIDQETLNNLESRQRLQEADVERMREREEVVKKIDWLESARPFAQYRDANLLFKESKAKMNSTRKELEDLQTELEPSLKAMKRKEVYKKACEAAVKHRQDMVTKTQQHADKIDSKIDAIVDRSEKINQQETQEVEIIKDQRKNIARIQGNIDRLKNQLDNPPPQFDYHAYNERIRERQRTVDECTEKLEDLIRKASELKERRAGKRQRIEQAQREIEHMASQAGKQENLLRNVSSETFRMWKWVQEHKSDFERDVFGPPIVECSVKDMRYVNLIESLLQKNQLLSFTVQTKNDFRTLSNMGAKLGLSEINIKTMNAGLDQFPSPTSPEEMQRYGFDSWALSHLEGPDPVLAMLCADARLNETGVSLKDTSDVQFNMIQQSSISSWVTSKCSYRITRRREYGDGATSTRTMEVKPARVWTNQPVDVTIGRGVQEQISGWEEEIRAIEAEVPTIKTEMDAQRALAQTHKEEQENLSREKQAKQQAKADFDVLPTKLTQQEAKKTAAEDAIVNAQHTRKHLSKALDDMAMEKARMALKYADAIAQLRERYAQLLEMQVMSIEATSDHEVLNARDQDVRERLKAKEEENKEASDTHQTMREEATKFLDVCKAVLETFGAEQRAFVTALGAGMTLEVLANDIQAEKARLELMHEGNGSIIRDFEQRAKKIEAATSKLDEYKAAKTELDQVVSARQLEWEPKLDELVGQISEAFSFNMQQINCAGEVGVWKDEDFDLWAIQIKVKFRESEAMSILDSHRQSGGERAVSTIFYLMSLQTLTKSPFRIVDEINQGMDPRNERLVHKRMVEIACNTGASASQDGSTGASLGSGGSQYFLITPKLLHDLTYARGMRVLCIASGEFMPQDQQRIDFKGCLDLMRGLKAEAASQVAPNGAINGIGSAGRMGIVAG